MYVREVIPNSAVDEAGLKSGDHLLTLDGQAITSDSRADLFANPQEGQTYTLAVQHVGDALSTDLTVHIHRYTRLSLVSRVLDGHIGYIQTFEFYDTIPQDFDTALASLHAQNVDSIIIDFRGNPGGVNMDHVMGRFLPPGTALGTSKGRRVNVTNTARSDGMARETLPVVVLVDDSSGSASEIAALAFEENGAATVIGTKTAGAIGGTARYELGDGSLLSITVAVYVSASGAALNGIGVSPDITVARTNDDIAAGRDPQLDAAIASADAKLSWPSFGPLLAA
ncbi:MAG: PDZ domain-containing protein [Thermomicrobia bacterium]|nr:PDZ domain-containing protein [Thermomicrobia bacterium]